MTGTVAQTDGADFTLGEGRGVAEVGWRAAVERLALRAVLPLETPTRRIALGRVQDLVGFWALWHLEGGGAGLERLGMSRATLYRKVAQFRESFGVHPDEFRFPGLIADPEAYLEFFGLPEGVDGAGMPRVLKYGRERPAKLTDY
jgi:hypothetical protein